MRADVGPFDVRSRRPMRGPPLRAMLASRRRAVEDFALRAIEAGQVGRAAPVRPHNTLAVDVNPAGRHDAGWRVVDLRLARLRRIRSALHAHDLRAESP